MASPLHVFLALVLFLLSHHDGRGMIHGECGPVAPLPRRKRLLHLTEASGSPPRKTAFRLVCAFVGTLAFVSSVAYAQQQAPPRDFKPEAPYRVKTLEELRPRTTEETALARLYNRGGDRLRPGANKPWLEGDDMIVAPDFIAPGPPPTELEQLSAYVCRDTVAFGRLGSRRVLMTPNESALFTIYEVDVDAWINPQQGPAKITVALGGGRVYVGEELYTYPGSVLSSTEPWLLFLSEVLPGVFRTTRWIAATGSRLRVSGISGTSAELIVKLQQASRLCASRPVQ